MFLRKRSYKLLHDNLKRGCVNGEYYSVISVRSTRAFLLGCKEGIVLLRKKGRICKAIGHIVDISTVAAETMKVYNSKWALVMYSVDGKTITSQNRIVVPMSSNVGDSVEIQYDRVNPSVLIMQSPKRFIVFMLCSVMTLIIAMVLKTR